MKKITILLLIAILTMTVLATAKVTNYEFSGAYLYGYTDTIIAADASVTREEASAIVYRILKQNDKINGYGVINNQLFLDVKSNRWSYVAIEHMLKIKAIETKQEYFYPNRPITRGEMSKLVVVGFNFIKQEKIKFYKDLDNNNEYYQYVNILSSMGILEGYPDNTIKINNNLTRSEFVKMMNIIINRDETYEVDTKHQFKDVSTTHWAYKDLIKASSAFEETKDKNGKYKVNNKNRIPRNKLDEYYQ